MNIYTLEDYKPHSAVQSSMVYSYIKLHKIQILKYINLHWVQIYKYEFQ
jgi:hypothetical protein